MTGTEKRTGNVTGSGTGKGNGNSRGTGGGTGNGTLAELLFPAKCPFCGRIMFRARLETRGMCENCAETVFVYRVHDGLSHEALGKVLKVYVAMRYNGAPKAAMLRYKFGGERWLAEPFAVIMHNCLRTFGGYEDVDLITCVPASAKRYAVRGYNQSELIARRLSELSGKPYRGLLRYIDRDGRYRATSNENFAERAGKARFGPAAAGSLYGLRVLVVDDIFTTGSTLNECAGILLRGGAGYVNAACIMSGRQDIYDVPAEADPYGTAGGGHGREESA